MPIKPIKDPPSFTGDDPRSHTNPTTFRPSTAPRAVISHLMSTRSSTSAGYSSRSKTPPKSGACQPGEHHLFLLPFVLNNFLHPLPLAVFQLKSNQFRTSRTKEQLGASRQSLGVSPFPPSLAYLTRRARSPLPVLFIRELFQQGHRSSDHRRNPAHRLSAYLLLVADQCRSK